MLEMRPTCRSAFVRAAVRDVIEYRMRIRDVSETFQVPMDLLVDWCKDAWREYEEQEKRDEGGREVRAVGGGLPV